MSNNSDCLNYEMSKDALCSWHRVIHNLSGHSGKSRQQAGYKLKQYDGYQRGEVKHAGSGYDSAQGRQNRLGDFVQNNGQRIWSR